MDSRCINLLVLSLLLMITIFYIDLQLPLGVAGGVPYISVILISLWLPSKRYVISLAVLCSLLVVAGYYFSPPGGELWKVASNRSLALFAIWVTAIITLKWKIAEQQVLEISKKIEKEKEKIYIATVHGAQHITNNLLNQLLIVDLEIKKHPDFDNTISLMFVDMLVEADTLIKKLSDVDEMDEAVIKESIYPKVKMQ